MADCMGPWSPTSAPQYLLLRLAAGRCIGRPPQADAAALRPCLPAGLQGRKRCRCRYQPPVAMAVAVVEMRALHLHYMLYTQVVHVTRVCPRVVVHSQACPHALA